jgi:hypothetical protein
MTEYISYVFQKAYKYHITRVSNVQTKIYTACSMPMTEHCFSFHSLTPIGYLFNYGDDVRCKYDDYSRHAD